MPKTSVKIMMKVFTFLTIFSPIFINLFGNINEVHHSIKTIHPMIVISNVLVRCHTLCDNTISIHRTKRIRPVIKVNHMFFANHSIAFFIRLGLKRIPRPIAI